MRMMTVLSIGNSAWPTFKVNDCCTLPRLLCDEPTAPIAPILPPAARLIWLSKMLLYSLKSRSNGGQYITPDVFKVGGAGAVAMLASLALSRYVVVVLSLSVARSVKLVPPTWLR